MVFPRLSVRENLQVAAFAVGQPASRVEELLRTFPFLYEKATEIASRLSSGQQQLLAIARALATDPRLLLLDEPSEGIQPSLVAEVLERVRAINRKLGMSVLLVEQNLEFAVEAATRVYIIDRGQIAAEMPSNALRGNERLQHELLGI
jgi:ABC-type branched-subunit amino acid transport system ATPase component